ncbi:MAG: type I-MYXAN CRISPR-associated Cas8a1/Cmx1 [Isosphaeraceae bacterium]|nr:type I-MYXAN CRISPR-associated Cas8a1/Cmx1 [Isosphaeraceae bacterium]
MDSLTIDLFDRGMGPLHRAGLGGLACTLTQLNWPTSEWSLDTENRSLTLRWPGGAEGAGPFFERLYARAFGLDDGMIDLPGAYGRGGIPRWIKAELQRGMSLTILQFGPNRKTASKRPKVETYEVDRSIVVEYQDLIDYTHRGAWRDLVTPKGTLRDFAPISGTIAPGFVQRHVVHAATTLEQPPGHVIALHFALVGTLSLPIGRTKGVLIVPDVRNLRDFIWHRPQLNPQEARDCQVISPADAALQAQVRLRAAEAGWTSKVERCLAILFSSTTWNPNQKARVAVLEVDPESAELDIFAEVMAIKALQPRLVEAKPEKKGDPPRKFWSGGVVRALIAENLAHHRPWFEDFRKLVVGPDGRNDEQKVRQLSFEREGLRVMVEKHMDYSAEQRLVLSIHEAMARRFSAIRKETKYDSKTGANKSAYYNKRDRQLQEWRLEIAGAKTADDLRKALGDLWSRSIFEPEGAWFNSVLGESWRELLPLLCNETRWQLNRDLALLALASYAPTKKEEGDAKSDTSEVSAESPSAEVA